MSAPPPIDLRSDTVTRPTPAMRRAMAEAEVGDDVLDGDPTTRRLEERAAQLLGMDDALFFPSGTQANQTGVALCTTPGTELLVEANAHLVHYELAGVAALWGVQIRPVATPDGRLSADLVRAALRPPSPHTPRVTAITIENTHNAAGGRVLPPEHVAAIVALGQQTGLAIHVDGARLWNAATALGVPPARLVRGASTAMVSFSKGLGCPVGSCLAFGAGRRAAAWELRKRLGGGMRQSGILAAAGLYALEHHLPHLAEDHEKARGLADRLAECRAVRVTPPETNIVLIDLAREQDSAATVLPRLAQAGLLLGSFRPHQLRAVLHRDVAAGDIGRAADIVRSVLS
jgi:threonine aldolase